MRVCIRVYTHTYIYIYMAVSESFARDILNVKMVWISTLLLSGFPGTSPINL